MSHIKKAFTLTELIVVVAIIWILMMWLTVYIWWLWERARIIETQWCAISFWWEMNNYVFNALTSKNLKLSDGTTVSPNYYIIALGSDGDPIDGHCSKTNYEQNWGYCNELRFWYGIDDPGPEQEYKIITIWNTCRQNQANMWLYRIGWTSWDVKYISMNKWFAPRSINERKVFYLQHSGGNGLSEDANKLTEGDIMVLLCSSSNNCSWGKEVGKFHVDARTQTITFQKCRFYNEDLITCEARED